MDKNLVIPKLAAREAGVTKSMISYWANRGYIEKHYTFGNDRNYLVDLSEVLKQKALGQQRRSAFSQKHWSQQRRDRSGRFLPLS